MNRFLFGVSLVIGLLPATSQAALLGFEQADGYIDLIDDRVNTGTNTADPLNTHVGYYDAGQFDATATTPTAGVNTGLWEDLNPGSTPGDDFFFRRGNTQNHRYLSGHSEATNAGIIPRTGDQILVGRTFGSGQSLNMRYNLDSIDLGGDTPSSTGSSIVDWVIWACNVALGNGEFHWTFRDENGDFGFRVGWDIDSGEIFYQADENATAVDTGLIVDEDGYDAFNFQIDLANDTASLLFTDNDDSNNNGAIFQDIAIGSLSNLTAIDWYLDADNNKVSFDDSAFTVSAVPLPAPALLLIGGLGCLSALRRRG